MVLYDWSDMATSTANANALLASCEALRAHDSAVRDGALKPANVVMGCVQGFVFFWRSSLSLYFSYPSNCRGACRNLSESKRKPWLCSHTMAALSVLGECNHNQFSPFGPRQTKKKGRLLTNRVERVEGKQREFTSNEVMRDDL